jgi:hypothetical protein
MKEEKNIGDLSINNEYLADICYKDNMFINFITSFNNNNEIVRIKILKKTKNCVLIGIYNENDNSLNKEWRLKDFKILIFEDLKMEIRKSKLNNLIKKEN